MWARCLQLNKKRKRSRKVAKCFAEFSAFGVSVSVEKRTIKGIKEN